MRTLGLACGVVLLAIGGCGGRDNMAESLPPKEAAKLIAYSIWGVVPEMPAHKRYFLSKMIRGSAVAVSRDSLLVSCRAVDGLHRVGITRHNKYRIAEVVAADRERGVCMLKAPDAPLNVARGFRWCGDLQVGEPIYAAVSLTSADVTTTEGRITERPGGGNICTLATDLSLPATVSAILFDAAGRLVGVSAGDSGGDSAIVVSIPMARDPGSQELQLVLSPTALSTLKEGEVSSNLTGARPTSDRLEFAPH